MQEHKKYIKRCLEIAAKGRLNVAPNPKVGCVIVKDNSIVAEGYHQEYGGHHAEVNAFLALEKTVYNASDCTVYVSLEPCSHFGKTPPCSELIINKRPKLVVVGMLDPNPQVAGSGVRKIKEAGIDVICSVLEDECRALNKSFIKQHTKNTPFITLKWAQSKDGFIGNDIKGQKQISSPENADVVHRLRAQNQAILVGSTTVNNDNPKLTTRNWIGNDPIKVVLSRSLSVDLEKAMFKVGNSLIYNELKDEETSYYSLIKLDQCNIVDILKNLHSRGIQSVLVEGGSEILNQFIEHNLWNEIVVLESTGELKSGVVTPQLKLAPKSCQSRNGDLIRFYSNG